MIGPVLLQNYIKPLFVLKNILTAFALVIAGAGTPGSAQQLVQIPEKIQVADMELRIREGARPILEGYVSKLVANNRYFRQMVDRADAYLPIVERIFQEEGLPVDFRYLVIQESSLVSYLVSTSNAVGYWQFKEATALEMGLRVDQEVDERMSIVPSSRSAARYLKRHNQYMQNWAYSLLAYYAGLGGAKSLINPEMIGSKTLDIDENTHWYILKFLAHKIAFEPHLYRNTAAPSMRIMEYGDCENKTVEQLSRETLISMDQIRFFNRWILKDYIPGDRDYSLILPLTSEASGTAGPLASAARTSPPAEKLEPWREKILFGLIEKPYTTPEPVVLADGKTEIPVFFDWNGIKAIQAKKGDNSSKLALLAGISRDEFLEYNDLRVFDPIIPGEVYYADNKKNRAKIPFHTVRGGESLWEIAQRYGIRMKSLMAKNRMERPEKLRAGRVLWMRHFRPAEEPIRYEPVQEPSFIMPAVAEKPADAVNKRTSDSLVITQTEITARSVIGRDSSTTDSTENESGEIKEAEPEKNAQAENHENRDETILVKANTENPAENTIEKQSATANPAPPKPAPVMPEPSNGTIRVSEGMTWYRISRHYRHSLDSLQAWNGPDMNLRIGRLIYLSKRSTVIPAESQTASAEVHSLQTAAAESNLVITRELYEVKPGDSCFSIARRYGMKVDRLLELNGKTTASIQAGERVQVEKQP